MIVIITHENADLDAVASSLLIKNYLEKKFKKQVCLYFPKGVNSDVKYSLKKLNLNIDYTKSLLKNKYNIAIFVDTSKLQLIKSIKEEINPKKIIVIDHHSPKQEIFELCDKVIIYNSPSLTEELFLRIGKYTKLKKELFLILLGILSDTSLLKRKTNKTEKIVKILLKMLKIKLKDVINFIKRDYTLDKKIALIKGIKRAKIILFENYIIGISNLSSFESDLANTLIRIGCDLSLVISYKKKEKSVRIVLRSKETFKIKAIEIAKKLAENLKCEYGGHEHACVVEISNIEKSLKKDIVIKQYQDIILKVLKNALGINSRNYKEIT